MKIKKKNWGGGGSGGGGVRGGVRVDVNGEVVKLAFVKIQKKKLGGGGAGGVRGGRVGGQGGWDQRIEAFVKIKKKK